jgi:tetratricopeptide (TPR) repeat protein
MKYNAKIGAFFMAALTLIYALVLTNTAITLLSVDEPVANAMGALIFVFPVFAVWMVIREFSFGIRVERYATKIETEGMWPQFAFEFRPSGRPTRDSADRVFESYAKAAKANPESALAWFSLGLAYDAAGDRPRARKAMRKALALDAKASLNSN